MERHTVLGNGVLRRSSRNPRYFEDGQGKVILLTGSHTWTNMQDLTVGGEPLFDYDAYLDMLTENNHNFIRLWQWGHFRWTPWTTDDVWITPVPYARSQSAEPDGAGPVFNLDIWNEAYFERLRRRVVQAGERGMYVSIMFFDGWCQKNAIPEADPWRGHPFHPASNVNGIEGVLEAEGGRQLYTLRNPAVLERQKAFIRQCIDTVNDLDNVLYEIINESEDTAEAMDWQYHMIDYIKLYESALAKQHPVGMSAPDGAAFNPLLFESNADWIAPGFGPEHEYELSPPAADGSKVILVDTDHIWGHGGHYGWAWKTFMRGMQPIFMDPWMPLPGTGDPGLVPMDDKNSRDYPDWAPLRASMGHIRKFADEIDLSTCFPRGALSSSGYCLADPGRIYLVFAPADTSQLRIDLRATSHVYRCQWFDPSTGESLAGETVHGGSVVRLRVPLTGGAVLYLKRDE